MDVGANLFIGNLAAEVDEKTLSDTFGAFGTVIDSHVARDADSGIAKGYAFVNYDNFESADAAIESMNGQFLCNKPITVQYALKKDGKGERHGSAAERLLAMQAKKAGITVAQAAASAQPAAAATPQMGIVPPGYPMQVPPGYGYPPAGYGHPPTGYGYPPGAMPPQTPYGYGMPYAYPGYSYPPPPYQQPPPPQ